MISLIQILLHKKIQIYGILLISTIGIGLLIGVGVLRSNSETPNLKINSVNIMKTDGYGMSSNSSIFLHISAQITLYHKQSFKYMEFGPCSFGVNLQNVSGWQVQKGAYKCANGFQSVNAGTYKVAMYPTLIPTHNNGLINFPSSITLSIYSYSYTGLQIQSNSYIVNYNKF